MQSYNQPEEKILKREDELTDISKLPASQLDQPLSQRAKQGAFDIERDMEHHPEPSTMGSLSTENLSSSNVDHDAGEVIHKGFEKATDAIAQGVEVIKRIIMQELPPTEGENLKEKAQNLVEKASDKVEEIKDKAQEKLESAKEVSMEGKPEGQEMQRGVRVSEQTDLYRSNSGSAPEWQSTQQMKDVAREKLGEYKEKFNTQGGESYRRSQVEERSDSFNPELRAEQKAFRYESKAGDFTNSSSKPSSFKPRSFESGSQKPKTEMKFESKYTVRQRKPLQSRPKKSRQPQMESRSGEKFNFQGEESFKRSQGQEQMHSFNPEQRTEQKSFRFDSQPGDFTKLSSKSRPFEPRSFESGSQKPKSQKKSESKNTVRQRKPLQSRPKKSRQPQMKSESTVRFEQGKEQKLGSGPESKIHEIEDLSKQLNQKVEELKKSAALPTSNAGETIIIIQNQAPTREFSAQQESMNFEQSRPKFGSKDEQKWRNQPSEGEKGFSEKISEKTQELKEGFRQGFDKGFDKSDSNMPSSGSERRPEQNFEQSHPKLGRRDEQQWRNQSSESQPTESGKSFTEKMGDKLKEKVSDKANELKESYQSNLRELERKADERSQEQSKEHHHHESEHHLTTESQSFRPSAESRSLLEHELQQENQRSMEQPKSELPSSSHSHQESEHHLTTESQSFKPSSESKSLLQKELLSKSSEGQGPKPSELKEKLNQASEQLKEKILPSNESKPSEGKPLKEQIYSKIEEVADKIIPLDEAEKQYNESQSKSQEQSVPVSAPPTEMKENITYHPRDIKGYEIQYVPKHESESHEESSESQPKREEQPESEEQPKSEEQSKPIEERVPLLDRVQHGIETASNAYKTIKGLFKPLPTGQEDQVEESSEQKESLPQSGSQEEDHSKTSAPPAEMKEQITYHPRDIRGYEIEYVPKHHNEGEESHPGSQPESHGKRHAEKSNAPTEVKETVTYHARQIPGYEIEFVPKHHEESEHKEQFKSEESAPKEEGESKMSSDRVPLVDRVSHGLGTIKGLFKSSNLEEKETSESKPTESASELSKILESQAEVLKTKYSALKDDQPHGEELIKVESSNLQSEESTEPKGPSLLGRVSGGLHNITDKIKGRFAHGKESHDEEATKLDESPREKIYEFNPKSKKTEESSEEKTIESSEKPSSSLASRIGGSFSHGLESVKGKFHSGKEQSSEETSTEQNQSVIEKLQGKIQGKETGEEVDKEGFRKVHDGFSETVDELKHEQNEQFHEQVIVANENPFEPLRTKQAAQVNQPLSHSDQVGGNLKEVTSNFHEEEQEMIPEDKDEEKGQNKGLFQKMKAGLMSKFGHGNKENEESL